MESKNGLAFTYQFPTRGQAICFKNAVISHYHSMGLTPPDIDGGKLNFNQIIFHSFSDARKDMDLVQRLAYFAAQYDGYILSH